MGMSQTAGATPTGVWIEKWINMDREKPLAPSTLTSYRTNFRLHINPAIGKIPLNKLTTDEIQRALKRAGGSKSKFIKIRNIIHASLQVAVHRGILLRNPCEGVVAPYEKEKKARALSRDEQAALIKALEGEYYKPMIEMYLGTGLRMGEGIPLLWSDIRLDQRIVDVNKKAIIIHDYATHSATPQIQDFCKTDSSIRKVVITNGLVEILKEHKAKMMEQAKKEGKEWSEDSLAFPNTVGNIVNSRNLQNTLKRIYKKAGITDATMHSLRHSYASNCFSVGVDIKAISEQLGHKTVKTTYNIYIHLLDDKKVTEIDKLNEIDRLFQTGAGSKVIPFPTGQKTAV